MQFKSTNPSTRKPDVPSLASNIWERSESNHFNLLLQDAQLIQIVDANLADAARRGGEHLVCQAGCTPCCHGAFAISPLDAFRLRTAMTELAVNDPDQAARIAERARQYLEEFGPSFPGNPITGILDSSPEAQAAFEDFANDAPCPVLNPENGHCDLYAARPMTCRVFGPPVRANAELDEYEVPSNEVQGFSVCELCFTHATPEETAAAEMIVPYANEQQVLEILQEENPSAAGDTIIAYCLDLQPRPELS